MISIRFGKVATAVAWALFLGLPGLGVSCKVSNSKQEGPPASKPGVPAAAAAPAAAPAPAGPASPTSPASPTGPTSPAVTPASPSTPPAIPPAPKAPAASPPSTPAAPPAAPSTPPAAIPATPPTAAPAPPAASSTPPAAVPGAVVAPKPEEKVVLTVAQGQIEIQFFEKDSPAHCENFKRLVKAGFFNGTTFHYVCYGFVQGGDPTGTGKGGIDPTIPAEIKRPCLRGSVVAARRGDEKNPSRASHGSQFLILKQDQPSFTGRYTVFGQVTKGMEIIDRIPPGEGKERLVPASSAEKIIRAEVASAGAAPAPQAAGTTGLIIQPKSGP